MMKHSPIILATATLVAASFSAHGFVTGFNFNELGSNQNVGDRTADFGGTATAGNPERGYFQLYTENSQYAGDTDPYQGQVTNPGAGWWQASDDFGGGFGTAGEANLHTIRGSFADWGASPAGFTQGNVVDAGEALQVTGAVNGGWFSFGIDGSDDGFGMFEDFSVGFQVRALDDAFAIEQNWWLIDAAHAGDIANGDFSGASKSGTFTPTLDYAEWVLDLDQVESGSLLVFGVSTTNMDPFDIGPGKGLLYDNVTFSGTSVIPEPSTYAMFAGVAALGLAWWRRRAKA